MVGGSQPLASTVANVLMKVIESKGKTRWSGGRSGSGQTLGEEDDLGLLGLGAGDGLDDVARVLRDAADKVGRDGELLLVVGGRVGEDRLLAARLDLRDDLDEEGKKKVKQAIKKINGKTIRTEKKTTKS